MTTNQGSQTRSAPSQAQMQELRSVLQAVKAEANSRGAEAKQGVLEAKKSDCSDELRDRLEGVMRRNLLGPNEGEVPPDFNLKLKGSDQWVQLSNFKGKKPVALAFGSYT